MGLGMHVSVDACGRQKKVLHPLELLFQVVVSHLECARSQTPVLWKNSSHS